MAAVLMVGCFKSIFNVIRWELRFGVIKMILCKMRAEMLSDVNFNI